MATANNTRLQPSFGLQHHLHHIVWVCNFWQALSHPSVIELMNLEQAWTDQVIN